MSQKKRTKATKRVDEWPVGSRHTVTVDEMDGEAAPPATGGDGQRLRVVGGVPGDVALVEVTARGRKAVWTRVVEVVTPSESRVEAPCAIQSRCGTCPWQTVRYRDQLTAKGKTLRTLFGKAGFDAPVHDPVGISPPVGYRTKVQMPVTGHKHNLQAGFWAPRSHHFVSAWQCVVQHPLAERVRSDVLKVLGQADVLPYNEVTGEGDVRTILLRVAEGTGQVGCAIVVRSFASVDWASIAEELSRIDGLTGVWANENDTRGTAVLGPRTVHLGGARRLEDVICGRHFLRTPTSFFQTNHRAAEKLVTALMELLPERLGTLVDLYSGAGLFAATLADRADVVHLVESNADAVAAARASLDKNGIEHAHMHLGQAEAKLTELAQSGLARPLTVVADPPRSGMAEPALAALVALAPDTIAYVSCHPKNLVRDCRRLSEAGYRLSCVRSVDMFPHTPHVEAVALLTRRAPDKPLE